MQQNKAHRAAMKELSVKVKIKFAEYREYQRAMAAYKDKMDRCVCVCVLCVVRVCVSPARHGCIRCCLQGSDR